MHKDARRGILDFSIPLVAVVASVVYAAQPNAPLDRSYSQRNLHPFALEERYQEMLRPGARQSFIFPSPCGDADAPSLCGRNVPLAYADSSGNDWLAFRPLAGAEYRYHQESGAAFEAGALGWGGKGPVSFLLDARLFAENSAGLNAYDREGKDKQDQEATGTVSYDSYARYRGNLNLDLSFGRFSVSRDAVHWGPGLFNNLVFHQDAVPFHNFTYTATLGPVKVTTLYGDLAVGPAYLDSLETRDRNLYAHRYELALGENILLGFSEQLILYERNIPFLFTPVFPLFIAKGFMYEGANNGNLALDASWRFGRARIYGEFLLDDLESPSSLFTEDYAQNKWAFMAGVQAARDLAGIPAGVVVEYSRIEPWVYSHFTPNTSQAANLDLPLGNQQGPNSQSLIGKGYARHKSGWYASAQISLLWKGSDEGSALQDPAPDNAFRPKEFLGGVDSPDVVFTPTAAWEWKHLSLFLSAEMGSRTSAVAGFRAAY